MTVINFKKSKPDTTPIEAAKALTKTSKAAAVREVLKLAVAANLDSLDQAELIGEIVARTTFKSQDLKRLLKDLRHSARLTAPDGPTLLAEAVLEQRFGGNLKAGPDGRFWEYAGTHWSIIAGAAVRRAVSEIYRADPATFGEKTKPTVDAAFSNLKDRCAVANDPMAITFDPPRVLNFKNGELWLDGATPESREHSPASGLVQLTPCSYDPDAQCPMFKATLASIFAKSGQPSEMERHLFEVIGYAIQPIRNHAMIVVLYGAGANLKSSLLRVLISIVGSESVLATSVGRLSQSHFQGAALAGKRILVDDDLSASVTIDDGFLKMISEAKTLTVRRPYGKQEFTIKVGALPILVTNNVPKIKDASEGLRRRLKVIPFERRFALGEIEPNLFDEIIAQELPGIINEALAGLDRLNKRKEFDEPADCLNSKETFFSLANPLRGFVAERLVKTVGKRVPLSKVWAELVGWCAYNHLPLPCSRNRLKASLEGMGFSMTKSSGLIVVRDTMISAKPPSV